MPKKQLIALAAIVVLLLVSAQLALAQQDTTTPSQTSGTPQQQYASDTPTTGGQTQPAGGSQSSPSDTGSPMHLNKNDELVIDCPTVSSGSTQTDQEAAQLCAASGYKPADISGESTQYQ